MAIPGRWSRLCRRVDDVAPDGHSAGVAKSWLCRIGNHRWKAKLDEDGIRYLECERCGKRSSDEVGPMLGGPDSTPLG